MVAVPAAIPVTIPDEDPTVAMLVVELLQVPPLVASVNVIVEATHTVPGPPIAAGVELMVTVLVMAPQVVV